VGRFVQRGDTALLEGALTLHPLLKAFMTFAFSSLSLLFVIGLVRLAAPPVMGDELVLLAGILGTAAYCAALLFIGRRLGRRAVVWIESRIAAVVGGRVSRHPIEAAGEPR
jgi:hypothetical protein